MKVLFTYTDEFLAELRLCRELVEDGVVRACAVTRPTPIYTEKVYMTAGFLWQRKLITLEEFIGFRCPSGGPENTDTAIRAARVQEAIVAGVAALGLQLRAGLFLIDQAVTNVTKAH